jgi:hypothetical protein
MLLFAWQPKQPIALHPNDSDASSQASQQNCRKFFISNVPTAYLVAHSALAIELLADPLQQSLPGRFFKGGFSFF